ncbi:glycogen debranching protein [Streptomyces sp. NBC_01808]|uniref:glycogen debranching N-terminal domain-containing protein n=1 Tax=Streptomyces sp. NBC_01808 TaxID=2975947 RepID=UPI002DDAB056|nr:glycogen debranching N-terminal domain-containing protein [Streptomyces sp. NBC_01808]WSA42635.1 glycogen debranching protein [Streptomyces sp. NBC_01808]
MPAFAVSARHGQLDGHGLEGFYRAGRRLVGRLQLRVGGVEPLPVQGRRAGADRVRFVGTVRTGAEAGPDPAVVVERVRHAAGVERITLHSSSTRVLRLTLEAELGTDLAELSAVAAGHDRREVPASVHESGLRWRPLPALADPGREPDAAPADAGGAGARATDPARTGTAPGGGAPAAGAHGGAETHGGAARGGGVRGGAVRGDGVRGGTAHRSGGRGAAAVPGGGVRSAEGSGGGGGGGGGAPGVGALVTAEPPPDDVIAAAGLLRWQLELAPGGSRTLELRIGTDQAAPRELPPVPWSPAAAAAGDDPRVAPLLDTALDDLRTLLLRDPAEPADVHLVAGVPWRCALAPADALWAARMLLPLGTRLAAGTLRAVARTWPAAPAAGAQEPARLPGTLRDSGPHLPPAATGVEATLLFPAVLAEARRWGLPERDLDGLLPAAERCLAWLRAAADDRGFVPDPAPGGPYRCETQAHAHRAALLGAELLDVCGRPGAAEWRQWAAALRERFRAVFWTEDVAGGRPAAALAPDGRPLTHLGSPAAHLLPTAADALGCAPANGNATPDTAAPASPDGNAAPVADSAPGLLDKAQTGQLAHLLGGPALDSGWGLRSLGAAEPGFNPFGHRAGAVHVHETAVAVAGLFTAGYDKEAGALLRGFLDAAGHFGHHLPEMYAGDQRTAGGAPLPHPAACRPSAVAAAAAVHILTALAGVAPDIPAGTVAARPPATAPLGAVQLTGWRLAEEPFAVRVSRLGLAVVEEVAPGFQLGS